MYEVALYQNYLVPVYEELSSGGSICTLKKYLPVLSKLHYFIFLVFGYFVHRFSRLARGIQPILLFPLYDDLSPY